MLVHKISNLVKPWLPGWAFSFLRRLGTALLTPLSFAYHTGHFKSSLLAKAVTREGEPTLWYTYPAIDFLSSKDFVGKRILEFGAGQSTLWWSVHAAEVWSLESNQEWYRDLQSLVGENVSLVLTTDDIHNIDQRIQGRFDVIVVDGLDRDRCAEKALSLINESGVVILDNSNFRGYVADLYRSSGFSRVDFYGYAPGVILPHCTSLFFKNRCWLFDGDEHPRSIVDRR